MSDAIEAAQYAIWRYTGSDLRRGLNWTTPNSETAYWHLLSGANASGGMTPAQTSDYRHDRCSGRHPSRWHLSRPVHNQHQPVDCQCLATVAAIADRCQRDSDRHQRSPTGKIFTSIHRVTGWRVGNRHGRCGGSSVSGTSSPFRHCGRYRHNR